MKWLGLVLSGMLAAAAMAQPEKAFELNERGLAASKQGDEKQAEQLYREAIDLWRQLGPQFELHLAITDSNLAHSLCAMGRRREAATLFQGSMAVFRRTLGNEDLRTLTNMNLLGGVLLMLGDNDGSEKLFSEALAIERQRYPDDLQTARSLAGLASVRLQTGKNDEALPFAEEALDKAIRSSGEQSLDTGLAYATVAEIHRSAGRPARALPLYRKARAIYEQLLGPTHVRVASLLSQEGLILMGEGKLSLAEQQMQRAINLLDSTCPACTLEHIVAETNLGLLRLKQAKYPQADRLLSHALALQEQYGTQQGPDLAYTLRALSIVRQKEHLYDDASRLSKRASMIGSYQ